ncbi:anti-sigma F factor antagonist [Anaerolentibacter hominis]|uniref:anti-sigma F factor antagonist n=1 Tax=Anaerolentibacter hominis TaxID=3079009 RepID=UPI0031B85A38
MGAGFEIVGKCLVIRLLEDLDHHNAVTIRQEADRLIENKNLKNLIFDFSQVDFMDSSGIGVIMGRYKQVIFTGGKTAVTGIRPQVDRIFKLSGLYKILDKYDTIEDALENLEE